MCEFDLNTIYFNDSLSNWVNIVHTTITKQYEMKTFKIDQNDFGFHSYATIINVILSNVSSVEIFDSIKGNFNYRKFMILSHEAWIKNYINWKQIYVDKISTNPTKTLNTFDRNDIATTSIDNLSEINLQTYQDTIQIIFNILSKKILEAGIAHLTII